MVRPTHDEILRGLSSDVALLKSAVEELKESRKGLAELDKRLTLLEQRVADMREGSEKWVQRIWMILAPIISAVIGAAVVYYAGWRR
jgi:FtsZ-binding cell division protein ZapB